MTEEEKKALKQKEQEEYENSIFKDKRVNSLQLG